HTRLGDAALGPAGGGDCRRRRLLRDLHEPRRVRLHDDRQQRRGVCRHAQCAEGSHRADDLQALRRRDTAATVTAPMTTHRWRALGEVYIARPAPPPPRSFGFTVGGVLAAIALFSLWRRHVGRAELVAAIS